MRQNEDEKSKQSEAGNKPWAATGNASNPTSNGMEPDNSNQLLDQKAEKYLREVASIEDVPDAEDQKDMDETLEKENKK